MDPKERELRQKLAGLLADARTLTNEGKLDEARTIKSEAEEIRKQVDLMEELRNMDTPGETKPAEVTPEQRMDEGFDNDQYRSAFLKSLRGKRLSEIGRAHV